MRVGLEPGAESRWCRVSLLREESRDVSFRGWEGLRCGQLETGEAKVVSSSVADCNSPDRSKEGTDHVTGGGREGGERCSPFAVPRGHFPPVPPSLPRARPHSSAYPQQVAHSKNVVDAP